MNPPKDGSAVRDQPTAPPRYRVPLAPGPRNPPRGRAAARASGPQASGPQASGSSRPGAAGRGHGRSSPSSRPSWCCSLSRVRACTFNLNSKLNRSVTLPAFSGQSAGQNWLITGSDSRQGLSAQQISSLHVGRDFGTENSDSIMLLHTGGGRPVLLSIPRDSYVPIPGHGMNKINAALGFGGPSLLIQTVEDVTGLRINHYLGIGFGGLVGVVNQVGGVNICLPAALHDADSGVNLTAGCHTLNGAQALAFVRDRHSFAVEDLQRIEDQRAFLRALLRKATSPGVYLNPFVAVPFGSTAASSIAVDQGTHLYNLITVAFALRNPLTGTVPVANANYFTANAGDALLWNRSEALQLFNALKNGQQPPANLLSGTVVG